MKNKTILLGIMLLSLTAARADVIHMKNGDVYHADIIKEDFGNFIQISLKDGSEKRLLASNIESVERAPAAIAETPAPVQSTVPTQETTVTPREFPSQKLADPNTTRFDLDLVGVSYDSTWVRTDYQQNGNPNHTISNFTNRYVRTAPVEATLHAYLNRWNINLDYLDSATNAGDLDDQSFSTLSVAYALSRNFDLGVGVSLAYANSSAQNGNSITGSDYGFGPYFRIVTPLSDTAAFEASGIIGLDVRNLSVTESSENLNGNDVAFYSTVRLGFSFSVSKYVSYLVWADGWFDVGTLSGTLTAPNVISTGTLQADFYRLRAVPVGVRIKF